MPDVRELSVALTLTDNFSANMRSINQQLKEADSAFKLASTAAGGFSSAQEKTKAVTEMLQQKLNIQKAAVDQYRQALDRAKATYDANVKKQQELQAQLERNKEEFGENSAEVKKTQQELQAMDKAVQSSANRVSAATTALNNAEAALNQTQQQLAHNTDKWTLLAAKLDDVAAKSKAVSQDLQKVGSAVSIASAAVVGVGTAAVNTFATYDDSLKTVQATMGLVAGSSSQADAAIALLDSTAQEMGIATRYSASEAASALNYLALAGYDAEKACEALPTVLQLAQAGGLDLAYASDLATDAMAALGMETSQLSGFVDSMAVTAQKSNTSVGQLGEAILTIGGTATVLAGGTTELNTALGVLANRGIKGSEGGTALRNVILSLSAPTEKARGELEALGVTVSDSEGNMRSLDAILADLKASISSMGDTEQQAVLRKIFNKNDLASVQALMAGLGSEWNALMANISESAGAAGQMAATMESGLGGQIRSLKSAVEGLGIALGSGLAPIVGEAVEFVTNLTRSLADMDDATKSNIIRIGLVVAAAGPAILMVSKVASGISGVATAISGVIKAAQAAGSIKAALAGLVSSPHFIAFLAIAGVIAGIVIAINSLTKATQESTQTAEEAAEAYAELSGEFDDAMESFNSAQSVIDTANQYKQLQAELAGTASAAENAASSINRLSGQKTDIKVKIIGDPQKDVTSPDDLATGVKDGASEVELNPEVGGTKKSPDDFIDGPTDVELTPQVDDGDKKTATDFVSDDGVLHMSVAVPEVKKPATDFAVDELALRPIKPGGKLPATDFAEDDLTLHPGQDEDEKLSPASFVRDDGVIILDVNPPENPLTSDQLADSDITMDPKPPAAGDKLEATELMTGTTVDVTGEAQGTIDPDIYIESAAHVSAEKGNEIPAGDFVTDDTVGIEGKPGNDIAAGAYVDGTATILGEAGTPIEPGKFVAEGDARIHGEPENILPQGQFVADESAAITGEPAKELLPGLFVKDGSALIHGEAETGIEPGKFVADGSAFIAGEPEAITPQKFVGEGTAVVTGAADEDHPVSQDELVSDTEAQITGKAANENGIAQSEFVGTDAAEISVTVEPNSLTIAKAEMATLGQTIIEYEGRAKTLNTQLQAAQADLKKKESTYNRLLAGADKTRLEGEIEALRGEIDSLETQIAANETRLETARTAYNDASTAAETLAEKQQQLITLARQLAGDTDGSIIKTYDQATAYMAEAEAAEAAAKAQQQVAVARMESSLSGMASGYSFAVSSGRSARASGAQYRASRTAADSSVQSDIDATWDAAITYYLQQQWNSMNNWDKSRISYNEFMQQTGRGQYAGQENKILQGYIDYLNEQIVEADKAEQEANATQSDYINSLIEYYNTKRFQNPEYSWDELAETAGMWFSGQENGAQMAAEAVAAAQAEWETRSRTQESETAASKVGANLDSITERVRTLTEAYNEAYDAAYKSMSGQFKLFEKAAVSAEASETKVSDMVTGLKSQIEYWTEYSDNLKKLKELGLDEGLLSELSDGSTESAAYVATLAGADASQITELNKAYSEVEQARKDVASTVASIETDFEATMQQIQDDLTETITGMDMSTEAISAANATIQAYANEALSEDNLALVQRAYEGLKEAAINALNGKITAAGKGAAADTGAGVEAAANGAVETAAEAGSEAASALVESANAGENVIETQVVTDQTGEELAQGVIDAAQETANQNEITIPLKPMLVSPGNQNAIQAMFENHKIQLPYVGFASGGRADVPSVFGEAGPEWAIPEEHSARTAALIDAVRRASGFSWAELVSNAARQSTGANLITNSNRSYTANANLNVGTVNVSEPMDADALFDTMAARNRATMRGYGS